MQKSPKTYVNMYNMYVWNVQNKKVIYNETFGDKIFCF